MGITSVAGIRSDSNSFKSYRLKTFWTNCCAWTIREAECTRLERHHIEGRNWVVTFARIRLPFNYRHAVPMMTRSSHASNTLPCQQVPFKSEGKRQQLCTRRPSFRVLAVNQCSFMTWLMRELVDADSVSLPTASTGGDAPQHVIVSRGNHRTCGSRVGIPPPRKTWDPKRGEEECLEESRE